MATYLKIENPGVCPVEGFILLGATSKRLVDNESRFTVGQFGSGGKLGVNVLLRAKLHPIVFCGNHKLEFGTKPGRMKALEGDTGYNRVVVKHGGTDEEGRSVGYSEELSQTDEYGILDWSHLGMAFREREMRTPGTTLAEMRRQVQFKGDCHSLELDENGRNLLKAAFAELALDTDVCNRVLAVARTIANLDRYEQIEPRHLCEAINYRMLRP